MHEWSNQLAFYLKHERNQDNLGYVEQLKQDNKIDELKRLFGSGRLVFGTAGIRGPMGPGLCQMNDLIIIQTTQGLVSYLLELYGETLCKKRGVIIGHDARHNSARFSRLAALAFLQKSIPVYYCDRIVPTPFIAHGVTYFNCYCGIMITASHNPKNDNGYKVYWANGAQILTPHDKNIQHHIVKDENLRPWSHDLSWNDELLLQKAAVTATQQQQQVQSTSKTSTDQSADKSSVSSEKSEQQQQQQLPREMNGILFRIYDELCKNYYAYIQRLVSEQRHQNELSPLCITYTTMHGVGHEFLTRALKIAGFKRLHPVASQMEPNPDFPTVKFPNPEEAGALDLAFETAAKSGSTLILANDPDADRCAAALYCPGTNSRRVLTGNEIGALLGWWAWNRHQAINNQQQNDHHQSKSASAKSAGTATATATATGATADNSSSALAQGHSSSSSGGRANNNDNYIDDDDDDDDDNDNGGATGNKATRNALKSHTNNYDDAQNVVDDVHNNNDDDDEDDYDTTTDKTPATPVSKPIIGEGYVQVTWVKGPHHHARQSRQRRQQQQQQQRQQQLKKKGFGGLHAASVSLKSSSKRPEYCYMLTTAVSSLFLQTMARIEGFSFVETLTGFKYMGNMAHDLLKRGKSVLFAYEEAIGYMVDSQILDKDGLSAAVQLAQCAAYLATNHSRTLDGQLDWLWTRYGYHYSINSYFLCNDPLTIRAIFHDLQSNYPKSFKSLNDASSSSSSTTPEEFVVTRIRDLNNGIDNGTADHKPDLPTCSGSFMVTFFINSEIRFTIRTSGTEPKIKYYSEIVTQPLHNDNNNNSKEGATKATGVEQAQLIQKVKLEAQARLQRFVKAAVEQCLKPGVYKLQPASS